MSEPHPLETFQSFAERFAAEHLDQYAETLRARGRNPGRKEINDPLWGTIGLSGPEVALIDSPLIQRLRLVRQLGVVHWVYPGAIHTRFEHTLGVLRQVQHLCSAVNNLGIQDGHGEIISQSKVNLLRMAAVLHDIGHAAFSHVSEHALDTMEGLGSISSEFALRHKVEGRSLSEIFAYFVVRSPSMRTLVCVLLDHDTNHIRLEEARDANADAVVHKIGNAIVGRSIDDQIPLLHEIISGPYDADKLDYFVRDSRAAGTPSLLDISRLTQKLSIRSFAATELPGKTGRNIRALAQHHLIGMRWSGISVLDELHLSRVLLFSKIYRHPKVVAIEQMIANALILLAKATDPLKVLELAYRHNDDELAAMSADALAAALSIDLDAASDEAGERIRKAADLLGQLRLRQLFVKAFQLQRTYPGDPLALSETQKEGLIEFRERLENPIEMEGLRQGLIDEVARISNMLGLPARQRADIEGSIAIRSIGGTPGGAQIGRAWLLPRTGEPVEFRDYLVNRTAWADSYLSDQPSAYVFSDDGIADLVFIAIERELRTAHGVRLPAAALESSKRGEAATQRIKNELAATGYYADVPFDLRPTPESLSSASVARTIGGFAQKLKTYQAPVSSTTGTTAVDPEIDTREWLRQFDNDDDVECAALALDSLRMIERRDTVKAIADFVRDNPEFQGGTVVPFGSARDSSALHSYFAADLEGRQVGACKSLEDAVSDGTTGPLLFVDDFVGSGGQSRDVLAAGFGREDLRADLGEKRDLFSEGIKHLLTANRIGFVFTAAWDSGMREVEKIARELGLDATVYRSIGEDQIPFLPVILKQVPEQQAVAFLARSEAIGLSLLQSGTDTKPGETARQRSTRLSKRKLGYGNRGMLLASPFNVPTQTFTPLWARGTANGAEWHPLMPRRSKN